MHSCIFAFWLIGGVLYAGLVCNLKLVKGDRNYNSKMEKHNSFKISMSILQHIHDNFKVFVEVVLLFSWERLQMVAYIVANEINWVKSKLSAVISEKWNSAVAN